jgi:hypothetical protein
MNPCRWFDQQLSGIEKFIRIVLLIYNPLPVSKGYTTSVIIVLMLDKTLSLWVSATVPVVLWLVIRQTQQSLGLKRLPGPSQIPMFGNPFQMPTSHEWIEYARWGRKHGSNILTYLSHLTQSSWVGVRSSYLNLCLDSV